LIHASSIFPDESVAIAGTPYPVPTATGINVVGAPTVGMFGAARVTAAVPTPAAFATDVAVIVTVPAAVARAADV
jgi:hypothetical protein